MHNGRISEGEFAVSNAARKKLKSMLKQLEDSESKVEKKSEGKLFEWRLSFSSQTGAHDCKTLINRDDAIKLLFERESAMRAAHDACKKAGFVSGKFNFFRGLIDTEDR